MLNNLRDDDLFNIVVYDDRVETFQPELQRYSSRTRGEAERYVENIREGGATNIDAALSTALGMIQDDSRPSYVLFLTDGLPTSGEMGELAIANNCRKANRQHVRLFSFGVGFDVNARLLDRLSGGNSGTSEYVKPDEDIEAHVSRFYSKMTSPALNDIRIELAGTDVNRTYPRDIPDLFEGGQLVWVGRYRQSGRATVRLTGKVGAERRSFDFPVELASARPADGPELLDEVVGRVPPVGRGELGGELEALPLAADLAGQPDGRPARLAVAADPDELAPLEQVGDVAGIGPVHVGAGQLDRDVGEDGAGHLGVEPARRGPRCPRRA